ncbi:MAG: hypothetical protein U0637_03085 [Phycisphaerales bacterium]
MTNHRLVASLALAACVAGLAACRGPERISYKSDTWSPKTISVLDTRTGESVVTIDVPVGKQLNLWFKKDPTQAENEGSDELAYAVRPWGDKATIPGTTLQVPPPSARRIDMTLRKSPEMPVK